MLTAKQESGRQLEKVVTNFAEQRMHLGSKVDHNNFDPSYYPLDNHNVVDIKIEQDCLLECSNDKETTFMNDDIMNEKLDYFPRADPKHLLLWILIMPFLNFSKYIAQRIKDMGVIPIELKLTATKTNFHTMLNRLFHSKLYNILKKFNHKKSPNFSPHLSVTSLPQYNQSVVSSSIPVPVTVSNTSSTIATKENTNLYQHPDSSKKLEQLIVRPTVTITHPCQIGHPDHEKWLEHQYELMSKIH